MTALVNPTKKNKIVSSAQSEVSIAPVPISIEVKISKKSRNVGYTSKSKVKHIYVTILGKEIKDRTFRIKQAIGGIMANKKDRGTIEKLDITFDDVSVEDLEWIKENRHDIYQRIETVTQKVMDFQGRLNGQRGLAPKPEETEIILKTYSKDFIEDAFNHINEEDMIAPKTIEGYILKLKVIPKAIEEFKFSKDTIYKMKENSILSREMIRDTELVISSLKHKYDDFNTYLSPITKLAKINEEFRNDIGDDILAKYSAENYNQNGIKRKEAIDTKTKEEVKVAWVDLVRLRNEFSKKDYLSMKHVLISCMTYIPPMRDQWGSIKLVMNMPTDTDHNYYCVSNGIFIINHYKSSHYHNQIMFHAPNQLRNIINLSITNHPRDWLITQGNLKTNLPYDSKDMYCLSATMSKGNCFGYGVNVFRHSFENFISENYGRFIPEEKEDIRKIMGHNATTALTYERQRINDDDDQIDIGQKTYKNDPKKLHEREILDIQSICEKIGGSFQ